MIQSINIIKPHGKIFWLTGLSGAGKSTLAESVKIALTEKQYFTICLDGDEIRKTLSCDLGFGEAARNENVRRTAEVAKRLASEGIVVLAAMMSPTKAMRETAKNIIGENIFREIFIHASLETCIERDTKGLYQQALAGKITGMSGLDTPFEPPESPFLIIDTEKKDENDCKNDLFYAILQEILET